MKTFRSRIGLALGLIIPVLGGCGDDSDAAGGNEADGGSGGNGAGGGGGGAATLPSCHPVNVDLSLCDPAVATFSLTSTNPWYPLIVGSVVVLEGDGEGEEVGIHKRVVRTVLDEPKQVMGVDVHVLKHETFFNDVIHEIAHNYYVEATDGTVCYFGEDVEFYDETGQFENTDGTWLAGVDGALPGVIMPAEPKVDDTYYQENAPGIALDQGRIVATDLTTTLGVQTYDTIHIIDTNPIDDEEPCTDEDKKYAFGIGEVQDVELTIVSFDPGPQPLPECHPTTVEVSLCDPATATFSLASTNPYYPLNVGSIVELAGIGEGEEAGIEITVKREVMAETVEIMGVDVHVLRHTTKYDDVLHEVAVNFYVEAADGTVCYFGEDVEFYDETGRFANTDGTWRAGLNGALPGVIMPAAPATGDAYYQENAPGIALDMGRVGPTNLTTDLGGQSYPTIQVIDTNPIDDEEPCAAEEKRYAEGIGEVQDTVLLVVSFTPGS